MMSRKVIPFVLGAVLVMVLLVAKSWGNKKTEAGGRYEKILTSVADWLEQGHVNPKRLDDEFSKEVFANYLDAVDGEKSMLLQKDVEGLREFETKIDNELRTGNMGLVPAMDQVFNLRVAETAKVVDKILQRPFDFSINETFELDRKGKDFPKTEAEKAELWRKKLKYMVLERYSDALEIREKNKGQEKFEVKADTTLERESRERVAKIWQRNFDRLKLKFNLDEKFNLYVNTIAETMDPHSNFFPPVEKRSFDEQLSGHFFGIGAQLQEQDGNIKIASLITGSPAWKSGEIQINDVIMKVAQGNAEPVDITGYEITDAVKIIRGKKDTQVKLTLKKSDGTIQVVSLIREEIIQEEAYARSAIVKKDHKIGYIFLRDFYANFEDPNGASSARDVAKEVEKLKAENVEGIVIDLRYNGGGSLQDVIKMVGLFIPEGPVVQVKGRDGAPSIYRDKDQTVLYDGPLAVMINEYSASASEIFAAAIQDYGRGVIVGTQSYGKGTVQRSVSLDGNNGFMLPTATNDLGSLKLTVQKFYRISGGSNQLKGITPDIILPDNLEFTESREKDVPNALTWDEIARAPYTPWLEGSLITDLEKDYNGKVDSNETFRIIRKNASWLSKQGKMPVSLQLKEYRDNQQKIKAVVKENETLQTLKTPLDIQFMQADSEKIAKMDKLKSDGFNNWLKYLTTDLYLDETAKIMSDLIISNKTVKR